MSNPQHRNFLGRGWGFPPSFDNLSGSVEMLESVEDIYSSLQVLMTTMLGERIMQPRYGCNLDELLFEAIDTSLRTLIADKIETAILYFEPRIKAERIDIDTSRQFEGVLKIEIDFTVKSTNSRYNFVFPFYKNEGSEVLTFLTSSPTINEST